VESGKPNPTQTLKELDEYLKNFKSLVIYPTCKPITIGKEFKIWKDHGLCVLR